MLANWGQVQLDTSEEVFRAQQGFPIQGMDEEAFILWLTSSGVLAPMHSQGGHA